MAIKKTLLIIGLVWPEPTSSAAGRRMLQLIKQFKWQGYAITFASVANKTPKTFDLSELNITEVAIQLNHSSFDAFIKQLQPNIVLFDRFITEEQFGWRVTAQCPEAIKILDTEDLHGLRKGREQALKNKKPFDITYLQNDTTKREIASIYRCDLSLIISEFEYNLLLNTFNINKALLYYLPFLEEPPKAVTQLPQFDKRHHFISIGNFIHPPNYDALLYLKQHIWPLIKQQLPKAQLHIYGAYQSQKITDLNNSHTGFLIKGFAQSAFEVMANAKLNLAPLRFGAGLKGKLIDAMHFGTPCIMSSIAAEGMFGDLQANGYIEDNPKKFAEKAVTLYTNVELWAAKQQQGFKVLNHRFNAVKFKAAFKARVGELSKALKAHRIENFTGQILRHHTMQSTMYLSKWIEVKNKYN